MSISGITKTAVLACLLPCQPFALLCNILLYYLLRHTWTLEH